MSTRTQPPTPPTRPTRRGTSQPPAARYRVARWVGVGVLVALVVAVIAVVLRDPATTDPAPGGGDGAVVAPSGLGADGSILIGDGPVTVTIYFDYLCPACGAFEEANGETLEQLLEAEDVTVDLRPISFLDRLSEGTEYSTRSANALATVVDSAPDHAWSFHRALYAHQPPEGAEGLTDEQLASIARDVSVPVQVTELFAERRHEAWVAEQTAQAFDSGVTGTPTILVDGEPFTGDPYQPGSLAAVVERAAP
ncbi:DsbA family protein [Nocardioides sp. T5]|uniref:DsbA family protein n=1 Tax=Nocardioides sp. T5 TaxID=3400182 RepID=UPI003A871268